MRLVTKPNSKYSVCLLTPFSANVAGPNRLDSAFYPYFNKTPHDEPFKEASADLGERGRSER
jgi:hypothetical protein